MQIGELFIQDCEIPTVPMIAVKVLNLVNDSTTHVEALQETIMADQSLASRVLRVANSVYFGLGRNVETISDAINVMGFEAIRNLTLAVATRAIYRKFGLLEQKLWEHSVGASVAAGLIAREVRFSNVEEAAVAGLLHDVGKAIMNNSHPERFLILVETVYNERATFMEKEKEIFGFGHAEVGGIFAKKWRFSDALCEVITNHHSHDPVRGSFGGDDYGKSLCTITALADAVCLRLGVGYRGPMSDLVLMDNTWKKDLGIGEEEFGAIINAFKEAYIREKLLFQ